jgi:hypothetical protein
MQATDRNGELVAHLAAQRSPLGEPEVVGIRGPPPANQAGLAGHEFQVRPVTVPPHLSDRQYALVDAAGLGSVRFRNRSAAASEPHSIGFWARRLRARRRFG